MYPIVEKFVWLPFSVISANKQSRNFTIYLQFKESLIITHLYNMTPEVEDMQTLWILVQKKIKFNVRIPQKIKTFFYMTT